MDNHDEKTGGPPPGPPLAAMPQPAAEYETDRVQLATRLLIGALLSGSGEVIGQLEDLQQEVLQDLDASRPDETTAVTSREALRYLSISLLLRGERAVTGGIRSGFRRSVAATRWTFRTVDRLTDNRLMRPFRRPLSARARSWSDQIAQLVEEGRREEQNSRILASESLGVLVDGVVDFVAENPELDRLIGDIVGQKSVGLAAVMADNTRSLTATGDYVLEGLVRRLLRRAPRQSLPPSPVEGQPQTMYRSRALPQEVDQDDR